MKRLTPLGLIAGGGELPFRVIEACMAAGRPYVVGRIAGMTDPGLAQYAGQDVGIGEIGKMIKLFRAHGVEAVCFAGIVKRPDFKTLKLDAAGLRLLPKVLAAARAGDDALLRVVMGAFEGAGFVIEGAEQADENLTLPAGPIGQYDGRDHLPDVTKAIEIAQSIGALDIGQGAVVCDGLVLAVEAQEGTDGLLKRIFELPETIRGTPVARRGVLAKWPKPIQDTRIDLPTIGVRTIEDASRAGLAGIVGLAGSTLILDAEAVCAAADRHGLFVLGVSRL